MIETALQRSGEWPDDIDWESLAQQAATAAIGATPHGDLIDREVTVEISVKLTDDAGADKTWEQIRDECALLALQKANLPTLHQDRTRCPRG